MRSHLLPTLLKSYADSELMSAAKSTMQWRRSFVTNRPRQAKLESNGCEAMTFAYCTMS